MQALCSEKDTELDAAGNMIAVDRYKGVIRYERPKASALATNEKDKIIFRLRNKNVNKRSLSLFKFRSVCSIIFFSGYENRTYKYN